MGFNLPLTAEHAERYARIIEEGTAVRRHYDLLIWLQGEIQHYLPHEIMLGAWGDFSSNPIRYDIASALLGIRTKCSDSNALSPLLQGLFNRWVSLGQMPYTLGRGESVFLLEEHGLQCSFGVALRGMRSILIHGVSDKRGQHDCLYIILSSRTRLDTSAFNALKLLLPYLDTAMGQVDPLICDPRSAPTSPDMKDEGLSMSEVEIMNWIKAGKTNSEIAVILGISAVALKNHLRNIFKKLHE
ncbi:XrtB/PEP-CTERM-associated transcriptional regulator EpsA [Nitrosovibrio tenuis]|nr:XrtB/PEP-CTERM-associated transcriptional regulator EpsA [Nitrosovibrio tenuis]